ncbi:sensor histidine kinase [Azoarcus taiwanensis]|uniref:histidine kinase n=1 Tax=Azoarcus taiwanensis TaxID=666964 RepID=A0A972FD71_9RHOO|nr:HAMP domain-containing sensor histidine kinase [Azoarcus taiwanensis]NMG02505.1 hypothetical protein [Azoarcus taiwanensis]
MNPMMRRLFHTVRDGLLIVSRDGVLRFANDQAQRLLSCELGVQVGHPKIARLVAAVEAGHLTIPHSEEIIFGDASGEKPGDTVRVHLLASLVGSDCVVVLHNLTEQHYFETAVHNLVRMVERDCRTPIREFIESASGLLEKLKQLRDPVTGPLAESISHTQLRGHALVEQFSKLAALAEISNGAPIRADDRILPREWIEEVAVRVEPFARTRRMRIVLGRIDVNLPAIYGSKVWLGRALEELLRNAVIHGETESNIMITMQPGGNFIRIFVRNVGRLQIPQHMLTRPAMPFQRSVQPALRQSGAVRAALSLGLPLVHQIVNLHGGRLSLDEDPDASVTATLELPAGAPSESAGLDLEQTRRYARDITRLIQHRNANSERSVQ